MEAKIQNLIILDKSGSMENISQLAIGGVNETIKSIQLTEEASPNQKQFITLVAFCGCGLTYLLDHVPAAKAKPITAADYIPCCSTPLYDAIGKSCNKLRQQMSKDELTAVSVTIITDGYENSSKEYTHQTIQSLIEKQKKAGWLFAYIGADHDVEQVAFSLQIDNCISFEKTEKGTRSMFEKERKARRMWNTAVGKCMAMMEDGEAPTSQEMEKINKGYFRRK